MSSFWLMKSEPGTYSIDDLKKDGTTLWTGVRNYQARNFMTQMMKVGDQVLFYHSSAEPPGVAGLAQISKAAIPDPSQFDKKSDSYDPKATKEKPIWFCVEVKFISKFPEIISLGQLRSDKKLASMLVLKKGQRLSIQPVTASEFQTVCKLG
ncbi:MAG: EVE domain-containing protein [Pseudobdellovibrionaceae bacterium]